MKNLIWAGILTLLLSGFSCNAQQEKRVVSSSAGNDIEVYYFHMTTRCTTCKTVEAEARKDLEVLYPEQFKSGRISFMSLNLEEETGKITGERLGVKSQTLLIVKGDIKINVTNEGFLYAVSNPEKFKGVIKEKVDPLIK
jgi:hypothetical protein